MKKFTAILLLTILVFNNIGYRLLILFAQQRADAELIYELDRGNYITEELISIKVPIQLPYQANLKDSERIDGEINFNGEFYRFVKRKVSNDTMTFYCIRNKTKTILEEKAAEYAGKVNDLPNDSSSKKNNAFKQLLIDYDAVDSYSSTILKEEKSKPYVLGEESIPHIILSVQGQPPEIFHNC